MRFFSILLLCFVSIVHNSFSQGTWMEVGGSNNSTFNWDINSLALDDYGNLFAVGKFTNPASARYVAQWDGKVWSPYKTTSGWNGGSGEISRIVIDKSGRIFATGTFKNGSYYYVATWNGFMWTELGTGNAALKAQSRIYAIGYDDSGYVYAAGDFKNANGKIYVARWNGSIWTEVGGASQTLNLNGSINSITSDDSGYIYIGGKFTDNSGKTFVAKWNGANWSIVGDTSGSLKSNGNINVLKADQRGNIYAAGEFKNSQGHYYVAKWDGNSWSELGSGLDSLKANGSILCLNIDRFDRVYASGGFKNGQQETYVATWENGKWSELGGNYSLHGKDSIFALEVDYNANVYIAGKLTNDSNKFIVAKFLRPAPAWEWIGGDMIYNDKLIYAKSSSVYPTTTEGRYGSVCFLDENTNPTFFGGIIEKVNHSPQYLNSDFWTYNKSKADWSFVAGDSAPVVTAFYGTKGVSHNRSKPSARVFPNFWRDKQNHIWVFGGNGYGYGQTNSGRLNDLWRYDLATNKWTWMTGDSTLGSLGWYGTKGVAAPQNIPGNREGGSSWIDSAGNLWMFGGLVTNAQKSSGYLNDLWRYNVSSGQWTWMKGDSTENSRSKYGTLGNSGLQNSPGARAYASTWVDSAGNFWLFGGSNFTQIFADLWRYEPATNQWTWISGDSTANGKGNYSQKGTSNSQIYPRCRYGAVSFTDKRGKMWLYGGCTQYTLGDFTRFINDLWVFDPGTNEWTWYNGDSTENCVSYRGMKGVSSSLYQPGSRLFALGWSDTTEDALWVYGGLYNKTYRIENIMPNDFWKYDLKTNMWSLETGDIFFDLSSYHGVKGSPQIYTNPGRRSDAVQWKDSLGNFWLFGGSISEDNGSTIYYMNDLWKYNPGSNEWTWVSGDSTPNIYGNYGTKGAISSSNMPGGRRKASGWYDRNSGHFWLFGGSGYAGSGSRGLLNDMWEYDPASNRWTWIFGDSVINQEPVFGTKKNGTIRTTPGSRNKTAYWVDSLGHFWLFGGIAYFTASSGYMNDMWSFNPNNKIWTWIDGDTIINQNSRCGQIRVWDSLNMPGARGECCAWYDRKGKIWIYSGFGYAKTPIVLNGNRYLGMLNDMWCYDPGLQSWARMNGDTTPDNTSIYGPKYMSKSYIKPGGSSGSFSWVDSTGNLALYGGRYITSSNTEELNDIWIYDIEKNTWRWLFADTVSNSIEDCGVFLQKGSVTGMEKPGGRTNMSAWVDSSFSLWMYGGIGHSGLRTTDRTLNDLWKWSAADALDTGSVTISVSKDSICYGSNVTISARASGAGPNPTYYFFSTNKLLQRGNDSICHTTKISDGEYIWVAVYTNKKYQFSNKLVSNKIRMKVTTIVPSFLLLGKDTFCAGSSVTFKVNAQNGGSSPWYRFSINDTSVQYDTISSYTSSLFKIGDILKVEMQPNNACQTVSNVVVQKVLYVDSNRTPEVFLMANKDSSCSGSPVVFTTTKLFGGTNPSYNFRKNGISIYNGNKDSLVISNLSVGDSVDVVLTSNYSCKTKSTDTSSPILIKILPTYTPTVTLSSNVNNICKGDTVSFKAVGSNGGPNPSYIFYKNNQAIQTGPDSLMLSNLNNNDTLHVVLNANNNCQTTGSAKSNRIIMKVNPVLNPSVVLSASKTQICQGDSLKFKAKATNGGNNALYTFFVNGQPVQTGGPDSITIKNLKNADTVKVMISTNSVCQSANFAYSNEILIVVNPMVHPTLSLTSSSSQICQGDTVILKAIYNEGGPKPVFTFYRNNSIIYVGSDSFLTNNLNNNDTIKVVMRPNNVCQTTNNVTSNEIVFSVSPVLSPAVSLSVSSNQICEGQQVVFKAQSSGAGNAPLYIFRVNGKDLQNSTTDSMVISNLRNGDSVEVELVSNHRCVVNPQWMSNKILMFVYPNVTPNISLSSSSNNIKQGTPVTFTASTANGGNNPLYNFEWNGVSAQSGTSNLFTTSLLQDLDSVRVILKAFNTCQTKDEDTSDYIIVNVFNGVVPIQGLFSKAYAYPLPFQDVLYIFSSRKSNIRVTDVLGKTIFETYHDGSLISVETRYWPSGVYVIQGDHFSLKVLKN